MENALLLPHSVYMVIKTLTLAKGMDSFCLANDSVFSSTKLDIDANATAMNSTLCRSFDNATLVPGVMPFGPGLSGAQVPCHLLELNTFADMPLEKMSCIPRSW